jgi:hypothetical protein
MEDSRGQFHHTALEFTNKTNLEKGFLQKNAKIPGINIY